MVIVFYTYIYIYICMSVCVCGCEKFPVYINFNKDGLERSCDEIDAVDYFFYQWDPSSVTSMEEYGELQERLCWKINLIWSSSMRGSWSTYRLQPTSVYVETFLLIKLFVQVFKYRIFATIPRPFSLYIYIFFFSLVIVFYYNSYHCSINTCVTILKSWWRFAKTETFHTVCIYIKSYSYYKFHPS